MILIHFPSGEIHYSIPGFGIVTTDETTGNLLVDGLDTTTCAADVLWKYIADQVLERDENGAFIYDSDHFEEVSPPLTIEQRLAALEDLLRT
jgi:hypothetical protein